VIPLGAGVRALAYCAPVDMRKGFEGLGAWARRSAAKVASLCSSPAGYQRAVCADSALSAC